MGNKIFAGGADSKCGGGFGESLGINEQRKVGEGVGGSIFAIGRQATIVDRQAVVNNISKVIVVVVARESNEDGGVAGERGNGGATSFRIAVGGKDAELAIGCGLGEGEVENIAALAGEGVNLIEEDTRNLAAGNVDATKLMIAKNEELVGAAADKGNLIEVQTKNLGEVEAGGGILEVDEEPVALDFLVNSHENSVAGGIPAQFGDVAPEETLLDAGEDVAEVERSSFDFVAGDVDELPGWRVGGGVEDEITLTRHRIKLELMVKGQHSFRRAVLKKEPRVIEPQ